MPSRTIKITNLIDRNADIFVAKWDDLSEDLKDEISRLLDQGLTPAQAVKKTFAKYNLTDKLREWTLDGIIGTAEGAGIKFASDLAARTWFLSEHFKGDDLNLSARVTNPAFKDDVVSTLQANLSNSVKLGKMTRELKDFTNVEDLRSGIRDIESQARKIMAGDTSGFKEFQSTINAELKKFERLAAKGADTVLSRAYNRVVKAAEKLKENGLNAAIENAIDKKARSNAYRLAHTEAARAYGLSVRTRASNDEDATGLTWHLSSGEGHCIDCENLDGRRFRIDELPEYPAHPNCTCNLSIWYGPQPDSTSDDYDTDDSTIPDRLLMSDSEG
jgi:hypothetical protein